MRDIAVGIFYRIYGLSLDGEDSTTGAADFFGVYRGQAVSVDSGALKALTNRLLLRRARLCFSGGGVTPSCCVSFLYPRIMDGTCAFHRSLFRDRWRCKGCVSSTPRRSSSIDAFSSGSRFSGLAFSTFGLSRNS
ncbi:hypothetical protein KCP75_21155 [Salmonella enterica subsp. enterica]|nr:hypothetical protein KCP75_21155 [Salmonella enterica subsp. enterica]